MSEGSLRIHQAVHGYSQGHQLLAASVQLRSRDAKTMLVLSDISGQAARIESGGYLTGYPLADSKLYVLARTWPAPEMPRPGCVWTHSLLIDFADLAVLSDGDCLLRLFRRPETGILSAYTQQLETTHTAEVVELDTSAADLARHLICALYGKPQDRIVAARRNTTDVDRTIVALWAQQWPRLRRSFRFCTLSLADRSGDYGAFDLQLIPTEERSSRLRFPNSVDAYESPAEDDDWIDDAIADLVHPNTSGLRSFMRQIGADVEAGRDAFKPICQFHNTLHGSSSRPPAIDRAIALFDHGFPLLQARTARTLLAKEVLSQPTLTDAAFEFVLHNLSVLNPAELSESRRMLGRKVWRMDPARIAAMMGAGDQEREIAEATLAELSVDELLEGVKRTPELSKLAFAHRPDLIESVKFWTAPQISAQVASAALSGRPPAAAGAIIGAILCADRPDLIPQTLRAVGALVILETLAEQWIELSKRSDATIMSWLRAAAQDTGAVADALAHIPCPEDMLTALAHAVGPDEVPNDYGTDPWLLAVNRSLEAHPRPLAIYLSAFLISRALGWRSRNRAELAQIGFDPVYTALESSVLPEEAWRLVDAKLPWSFPWLSWDRCLRLRSAIIDLFVDRDLSAGAFANVTDDVRHFGEIVASLSKTYRGRRYLEKLRHELDQDGSSRSKERIRIVDDVANSS